MLRPYGHPTIGARYGVLLVPASDGERIAQENVLRATAEEVAAMTGRDAGDGAPLLPVTPARRA